MVDRLGWTLLHFLWEGAAVAALLAVALFLTRKAASNLRYGLALAALAVTAALPAATFLSLAPAQATASSGTARFVAGGTILPGGSGPEKMPLLVGLWAIGVALMSLRLVGALIHLERWRRHTQPASEAEQGGLDALARRLGLGRTVTLLFSDRMQTPSAWGVLRPVVVLPLGFLAGMPPEQAEGILLHELAHIRRHDYLVNLAQSVVETALFYHPAVWWISSVVRREREFLCDDLAVAALGDPMPYARALLYLAERRKTLRPALSAKEGNLMDRIARILAPRPAPVRISPVAPTVAALGVLALVLGGYLRAEAHSSKAESKTNRPHVVAAAHAAGHRAIHAAKAPAASSEIARLRLELRQTQVALAAAKKRNQTVVAKTVSLTFTGKRAADAHAITFTATKAGVPANRTVTVAATSAKNGATVTMRRATALIGLDQGAAVSGPEVTVNASRVSIDADHARFDEVIRLVAKKGRIPIVVEGGAYNDVTAVLQDQTLADAIEILCHAGHATYRVEGNVYFLSPKATVNANGMGGGMGD